MLPTWGLGPRCQGLVECDQGTVSAVLIAAGLAVVVQDT
jgi:hypothetical protein